MSDSPECLFCGRSDTKFCFRGHDRWLGIEGSYNVFRCAACRLLFLHPQPSPEQLARHYPSNYYAFQGERTEDRRHERLYANLYGPQSSALRRLVFSPYRPLLRSLPSARGGRLLDVGCGSGHFLATARKILGADVYGVEPYSYDATFAERNKLSIFNGTVEQAEFPDAFFDVITMNHVFEHLRCPRSTLRELRRIIKPGGEVIIGVPQSRSLLYWIFGSRWWQLDVPRHLFVPCARNLKTLAEGSGFTVRRVRYNSTPESILASFNYWRRDIFHRSGISEYKPARTSFVALLPLAYALNLLRIGDQIEMTLVPRTQ